MPKVRIDKLLVDRGMVKTREKARALIMAGDVLVEDTPVHKAGTAVDTAARLRLRRPPHPYVGRGGVKLRGALDAFQVRPAERVAADIGASTGGFTDCLLQHGALRVYAIDVDTDQLDWRIRRDSRVRPIQLNARYLDAPPLPETVDLVTIDVSFISVLKILPVVPGITDSGGDVLVLVKPQFEVGRENVGKGGIVSDPRLQHAAIETVRRAAEALDFAIGGTCPSPITGKQGNQEFFLWLKKR